MNPSVKKTNHPKSKEIESLSGYFTSLLPEPGSKPEASKSDKATNNSKKPKSKFQKSERNRAQNSQEPQMEPLFTPPLPPAEWYQAASSSEVPPTVAQQPYSNIVVYPHTATSGTTYYQYPESYAAPFEVPTQYHFPDFNSLTQCMNNGFQAPTPLPQGF